MKGIASVFLIVLAAFLLPASGPSEAFLCIAGKDHVHLEFQNVGVGFTTARPAGLCATACTARTRRCWNCLDLPLVLKLRLAPVQRVKLSSPLHAFVGLQAAWDGNPSGPVKAVQTADFFPSLHQTGLRSVVLLL